MYFIGKYVLFCVNYNILSTKNIEIDNIKSGPSKRLALIAFCAFRIKKVVCKNLMHEGQYKKS